MTSHPEQSPLRLDLVDRLNLWGYPLLLAPNGSVPRDRVQPGGVLPMDDQACVRRACGVQRSEKLVKTFRCGDVVPGCTRTFTGTEQDILGQVAAHAKHDHGLISIPDSLVNQVRGAMSNV